MKNRVTICDEGAKNLASAVIVQAVRDIRERRCRSAAEDVRKGGLDLYLDLMGIEIDHEAFITRARKDKK